MKKGLKQGIWENRPTRVIFQNGKLYQFKPDSVRVTRLDPPARWEKSQKIPYWQNGVVSNNTSAGFSSIAMKYILKIRSGYPFKDPDFWQWVHFLQNIRTDVLSLIHSAELTHHFPLYRLSKLLPDCFSDLFFGNSPNPTLGILLSKPRFFSTHKHPWRSLRRASKKGPRELLKVLGFPPQKGILNLLKKIAWRDRFSIPSLKSLQNLLKSEIDWKKIFSHYQAIPSEVIQLAHNHPNHFTPEFFESLAFLSPGPLTEISRLAFDSMEMNSQLVNPRTDRINTPAELQNFHHSLVELYNTQNSVGKNLSFPPPPVPKGKIMEEFEILPVECTLDLLNLGKKMKHCVGIYTPKILQGHYYIYQLVSKNEQGKPEFTLGLVRQGDRFLFDQIKGVNNESPSLEFQKKVEACLEKKLAKVSLPETSLEKFRPRELPMVPFEEIAIWEEEMPF